MKRVMIVGAPGSGKSTLARALGEKTNLPVFHMDQIHYAPAWCERTSEQKNILCHDVHMQDKWIFEGGHSRTYVERLQRADTYIWLDVSVWRRLCRIICRSVRYYGKTRPDLPHHCTERLNWQTLEFLWFVFRTRHVARAKLLAIYKRPPCHLAVVRLSSIEDADEYVGSIKHWQGSQRNEVKSSAQRRVV